MLPPTEEEVAVLTGIPGAVGLLPFQEGQCLVIAQEDNFRTLSHRCGCLPPVVGARRPNVVYCH